MLKLLIVGAGLVGVITLGSGLQAAEAKNPLLAPWTGPYGGVPPFDKVRVEDMKPALEEGMAEQLAEIDKIAANREAPSFENTIAAMERTGRALDRASRIYGIWGNNM